MKLSMQHLQRYRQLARLLWKYGRADVVAGLGMEDAIEGDESAPPHPGGASPKELADDLEAMGPAYVKLGQVLSSRPDLVPALYIAALSLLGKTLIQLDQIGKILDPQFDPNAAIRRNASEILAQRMRKQASRGSVLSSMAPRC